MSDIIDRANERQAEIIGDALAEQSRRAGLRGKTARDSALECMACGEPIPYKRRQALPGVQTCLFCQEELERSTLHPPPRMKGFLYEFRFAINR